MSLAAVDLKDRRHEHGKAALRGYWGFLFANLDFAADRSGGSAWQAALQSRLGGFGFLAEHAQSNTFVSERFVSPLAPLRSRTIIRLDTAIPETWLPRIPVLLEVRQDRLESGQRISALTGRFSAFRRGFAVANQTSWSFSSEGGAASNASGQLLVSKFHSSFALRGEIDYGVEPNMEVTNVILTGETRLVRGLLVSGGVSQVIGTGQTRFLAGVSKLEGAFGLGVTADYSSLNGLGASALLSMSAGRDAKRQVAPARPLAGSGAVSGRAFLDANGNGLMDAGEEAIADAGFLLKEPDSWHANERPGRVSSCPISPPIKTSTSLSPPPPSKTPSGDPRTTASGSCRVPGKVAVVDFPVVVSGEITGTVFLKRDGKGREASGVDLELVDREGLVVKKVRTAYDGFYDITDIKPGGYTLSVAAEHVVRLQVVAVARREHPAEQHDPRRRRLHARAPSGTIRLASAAVAPSTRPPDRPPIPTEVRVEAGGSPPRTPSAATPPQPSGAWALQLQSLRDAASAEREAHRLSSELARPTRVVAVDLGARGKWHRVYLVGFSRPADAESMRQSLAAKGVEAVGPVRLTH